jgi:hypothetical protein
VSDVTITMTTSIVELLRTSESERDLDWLITMLGYAVKLELSTIPPYLCGLWSIKDPAAPDSEVVYNLVRSVVLQEMVHMGLACNMLTTIGGTPEINANIPQYPGHLPGDVRPELTVYLAGLSKPYVSDVFMEIEEPEWALKARFGETYPTIGAFYEAILKKIRQDPPPMSGERQLQMQIGNDEVFPILTLPDAERAIVEIMEQGEGTRTSPLDMDPGDELAHYYRFGEIYHGRYYVQTGPDQWDYVGDPIPFPDVYPMAKVPAGGYPDLLQERHFRQIFATVLDTLQGAWAKGDQSLLDTAIAFMFSLGPLAQQLMQIPLPDGSGTYGPDFQLYPPNP